MLRFLLSVLSSFAVLSVAAYVFVEPRPPVGSPLRQVDKTIPLVVKGTFFDEPEGLD